jgi:hypothetical protein
MLNLARTVVGTFVFLGLYAGASWLGSNIPAEAGPFILFGFVGLAMWGFITLIKVAIKANEEQTK